MNFSKMVFEKCGSFVCSFHQVMMNVKMGKIFVIRSNFNLNPNDTRVERTRDEVFKSKIKMINQNDKSK